MNISFLSTFSEDDLINGCLLGNKKAQKALYQRFAPKMYAVCLRYSKDVHAAEDILQDGFIKVFRNIEKFRREGSFEGWIRRIFVNTAIEHLRKHVNLYSISDDEEKYNDIEDPSTYDHLTLADLTEMIQNLSPGYRTIFNLYAVEGFSHKEIAEMLQISEGTSKSQLARARQILQKKLTDAQKRVSNY